MEQTIINHPRSDQQAPCRNQEENIRGTILIIEDEEDLAKLLRYTLSKEQYQVHIAENGRDGFDLALTLRPDMILLDIMLPDLDGWEICRRIRNHQDPSFATTPIILQTALREDDEKFKGLELGADLFVKKPYSPREIVLLCRNFVRNRRMKNSMAKKTAESTAIDAKGLYQLFFHELRTQLVVIGALSSRLCGNESIVSNKGKSYAETIQKSTSYLEKLSRDVHLLEEIGTKNHTLPTELLTPSDPIAEVVSILTPLMEKKGIKTVVTIQPPELPVEVNRKGLLVILSTILENSIKYCPARSTIGIRVTSVGDRVHLMVADNGPGIPHEEHELVFEKYYRGRESRSREPGTGLGLFFARSLTEAMGGTISIEEPAETGVVIRLDFAQKKPAAKIIEP